MVTSGAEISAMIVTPFRGLRPRADLAAAIPSLPYDVLDSAEARVLADGDPHTFLHVVKAEIDLDPAIDAHDERVYAKARENFAALRADGRLVTDRRPAFYLYRQSMGDHVQTGVVGAAAVDDYLEGRIKRHEHTRPDKEDDRTRHADAIGAHAGPVFLAYRDSAPMDLLVAEGARRAPDVEFVAKGGIGHALWVIDDPGWVARFAEAFRVIPASYIADGHHRAAAYARVSQLRRARATRVTGDEPFNRFLAVHFPASQLRILDYNRLVRDVRGLSPADLLARIGEAGFEVTAPWVGKRPEQPRTFGFYAHGVWRLLTPRPGVVSEADPVARLDVAVLQDRILGPVLGIGDPRTDDRIAFVGGIRGVAELEHRVDSGEYAAAFAMVPTSLEDVMRVADAGAVMPPKSTWFEPKLRSGMVVHLLDEA
jgi:uncharacterized protein (DUF1015 family)